MQGTFKVTPEFTKISPFSAPQPGVSFNFDVTIQRSELPPPLV